MSFNQMHLGGSGNTSPSRLRRATSPQGEAVRVCKIKRLPLRGKPAKRRQWREKRAGFEEAARLAGPPGTGNRFAATVWLPAKPTERCCRTPIKIRGPHSEVPLIFLINLTKFGIVQVLVFSVFLAVSANHHCISELILS